MVPGMHVPKHCWLGSPMQIGTFGSVLSAPPPPRLPPLYPTLRCAGECLTTSSWEEKKPKTVADLKLPYNVNGLAKLLKI